MTSWFGRVDYRWGRGFRSLGQLSFGRGFRGGLLQFYLDN